MYPLRLARGRSLSGGLTVTVGAAAVHVRCKLSIHSGQAVRGSRANFGGSRYTGGRLGLARYRVPGKWTLDVGGFPEEIPDESEFGDFRESAPQCKNTV